MGSFARGLESTIAFAIVLSGCCFFPTSSSCDERCAAEGACTVRMERAGDGAWTCYAASDADCQRSEPCRDGGRCYAAEDGTCVRASEVASRACAISEACRERGDCRARDGFCEAQRPEDCTQSTNCRVGGRCTLDPPTGGCFVTPESCAASEDCATRGLCGYERDPFGGRYGTCVLVSGARPLGSTERELHAGLP